MTRSRMPPLVVMAGLLLFGWLAAEMVADLTGKVAR